MAQPQSGNKLPAGSILIDKILMTSEINFTKGQPQTLDLKSVVLEFNIFESLHNPFISGDLTIGDGLALTSVFPIVGQEFVDISFKTPDESVLKSVKVRFRVASIENYEKSKNRTALYIIHLVSEEYFTNIQTRIMKSIRQKTISDMVSTVLTDFMGTKKNVNKTTTDGLRTIVFPNMKPVKALNFLCREAKSVASKNSNYVFFENCDGFNFTTIDELITKKKSAVDTYYSTPKDWQKSGASTRSQSTTPSGGASRQSSKPFELTKINHFSFESLFNNDRVLAMGGWENTYSYIDPVFSEYSNQTTYDYLSNFNDLKQITSGSPGHLISTEKNHLIKTKQSMENYFMTNKSGSGVDKDQKPDFFHLMKGSLGLLEDIVVNVNIPGDSDRRAGDIVRLNFPEFGGTDDVIGKINRYVSGNYLVAAVRHIYNDSGYSCVMQCVKNTYEKDVPSNYNPETADVEPTIPEINTDTSKTSNSSSAEEVQPDFPMSI